MEGYAKTVIDVKTEEGCITLFNTSAYDFYRGKFTTINDVDYINTLKANILFMLVEFERVMKGCFGANILLDKVDAQLFRQMYPNFSNNIFSIKTEEDLKRVGKILSSFRNVNAHAIPAFDDYWVFENDFSSLSNQKRAHPKINYLTDDGLLTLGGLIFIALNLARDRSIKTYVNKDRRIGYLTCGRLSTDDGVWFVNQISKVNLELQIRNDNKTDLVPAIFGTYTDSLTKEDDIYELIIGTGDDITIHLSTRVIDNKIEVAQHSLTNVFYEDDYCLIVEDKKHFLELANQFPAFTFVDLLYKLKVSVFDESAYLRLINDPNWKRYEKLKYAKFYVDKNIDILIADDTQADIRMNSNVCNSSIEVVFMRLEKLIIKFNNIDIRKLAYSRLTHLLALIDAPKSLIASVRLLRNSVFHGQTHNEYLYTGDGLYQYTLEFAIQVLCDLVVFFKKHNRNIYEALCKDISIMFISPMLSIKTKLFIGETIKFVNTYPICDNHDELVKKHNFYCHSSCDSKAFAKLNKLVFDKPRYMQISCDEFDTYLIFSCKQEGWDLFNNFIDKNGFKITESSTDGVVLYKTICKS